MNLLTLQICKEEAEDMIKNPFDWAISQDEGTMVQISKIQEQGKRTLEVINAYESRKEDARKRGIYIK